MVDSLKVPWEISGTAGSNHSELHAHIVNRDDHHIPPRFPRRSLMYSKKNIILTKHLYSKSMYNPSSQDHSNPYMHRVFLLVCMRITFSLVHISSAISSPHIWPLADDRSCISSPPSAKNMVNQFRGEDVSMVTRNYISDLVSFLRWTRY